MPIDWNRGSNSKRIASIVCKNGRLGNFIRQSQTKVTIKIATSHVEFMTDISNFITDLYKSESARLLAVLTRIFGPHNLDLAEDTLQEAFSKAFLHWQDKGIPPNPSAWIVQTAKNQAIDLIRQHKTKIKFSEDLSFLLESEWSLTSTIEQEFKDSNIKDDQLRMIFMCCHEDIKPENRIPFILRTLCGFSIPAISRALILPEATVKKRLLRTKEKLKEHQFEFPSNDKIVLAMDSVHTVLYLLFNEGFHSSDKNQAINLLFCQEAIGLINLLIEEPRVVNQDTLSLFALMHFHIARVDTRVDSNGCAIPLDLQDRSRWKKEYINTANYFLVMANKSQTRASGRFYIEAHIAKVHCEAPSFEQTNWSNVVELYERLIAITNSPIASLNQAIAIGYQGNVKEAILKVNKIQEHPVLKNSHMPVAILAHLHAMLGDEARSLAFADDAKKLGGTPQEHQLMMQQIERLLANN